MKKIIITALFLIVAGVSGYFLYSDIQEKSTNKDFSFDVIRSLNEVYISRDMNNNREEESNQFEHAYFMEEHVSNAKDIMEKWESDENKLRKKVATSMLDGIDNILIASDAYFDLMKNPSNYEENLALFKVKLEEGRKDLWRGASGLILEDDGIKLAKTQKQDVINYIENIFEEELNTYKKYQENEEKDENFNQTQEVWAAIIIRNGLLK